MGKILKINIAKITVLLFSFSLLLSTLGINVKATATENNIAKLIKDESKVTSKIKFKGIKSIEKDIENEVAITKENKDDIIRVIIELKDKPAALKTKNTIPSEEEINSVLKAQESVKAKVMNITKSNIKNSYGNLINGFSLDIKREEMKEIENLPEVLSVREANKYYPDMTTAKEFTQALNVWQDYGFKGEGLVVSIIDTGIDYTHKDMKSPLNTETMKIKDTNPSGPGKYYTEKIPYGYNYADKNLEVIDTSGSMHGMHVAGIVAADASDEEVNNGKGIQGVAPQAQLLAMKVFSNNPDIPFAYADDIIAAIEDSIKHGADIINMSLGSPAGYRNANDPEQKAIKNAADEGVISVVSAGNSSYSSDPYIFGKVTDVSTVGSPGLSKDALQVASYDNKSKLLPALTANIEKKKFLMGFTQCDIDPLDIFLSERKLEIVDCGLGTPSDFEGKNLLDKVALIKRGDIAFSEKQINAQNSGAIAVIIYNDKPGNEYINMASDPSIKIPAMFIKNSDGIKLKENIINNLTISFENAVTSVPNYGVDKMSSFSSWGPAPNLDFAPQITGPGGSIYSTLNNNKYGTKSGTSMSAPHVAGSTALIIQALKKSNLNLSGRELIEYVKNTIINTSQILMDNEFDLNSEIPYSPRRQGAGMIQTKDALENRVLALGENGEATISLKEIDTTTTFPLIIKNYGNKEETYNLSSFGGVLTAYNPGFGEGGKMHRDIILEGASLTFDNHTITVPAGETIIINATLNLNSNTPKDIFVEGFIKLEAVNESTFSLTVPYMGFYGEWDSEKIINPAPWEKNETNILPPSFAAIKLGEDYHFAGLENVTEDGVILNPEKIAISPNDDGYGDTIIPALYLMRNAKDVYVDVLDSNDNIVAKKVNTDTELRKKIFSSKGGNEVNILESLLWDGNIYDSSSGEFKVVEGDYTVVVNARVDLEDAKYQQFKIPVKIDNTKPTINITSSPNCNTNNYELVATLNDSLSGLNNIVLTLDGKEVDISTFTFENGILKGNIQLNEEGENNIILFALDNAFNEASTSLDITVGTTPEKGEIILTNVEQFIEVSNSNLTIEGYIKGNIEKVSIGGVDTVIKPDKTFSVDLTLEEGMNYILIYGENVNEEVVVNYSMKAFCDTEAPIIKLENPLADGNNVIKIPSNKLIIKGYVSDNTNGYKFYLNGENLLNILTDGEYGHEITKREFSKELKVNDGDIIYLKAVDNLKNETILKYKVKIDSTITGEKPKKVLNFKGKDITNNSLKLTWNETTNVTINEYIIYKDGVKIATVNGTSQEYLIDNLKANTLYNFKIIAKSIDEQLSRPVSINIRTKK
ncbi:S8 family serine peptidase [Clostridium tarantellae]|uniref:S8 family serine peptidase n=1 Tax=Clostridium tarantellae TaxID=39493 RepID=A0A6I1MJB1_9CLOT|nr:S8 family serine peptidase [Clostridium tarantellae]MPQ43475.1 S8 family serine peptidase [Clostridium tarantellae]